MSDYITIPLSKTGKYAGQFEAIVSCEDSDLANVSWNIFAGKYAQRRPAKNAKLISMHRVILERMIAPLKLEKGQEVDHIDGNGLNNQRSNLRRATPSQNGANKGKKSNNTSGYKGVYYHPLSGLWAARVQFNKKVYSAGYFKTPEEAHEAYKIKAKEIHGEFANFGDVPK